MIELLEREQVERVVPPAACGIPSPTFVERFPSRIINIHHSFLPASSAPSPTARLKERGVKVIGATAHYDRGARRGPDHRPGRRPGQPPRQRGGARPQGPGHLEVAVAGPCRAGRSGAHCAAVRQPEPSVPLSPLSWSSGPLRGASARLPRCPRDTSSTDWPGRSARRWASPGPRQFPQGRFADGAAATTRHRLVRTDAGEVPVLRLRDRRDPARPPGPDRQVPAAGRHLPPIPSASSARDSSDRARRGTCRARHAASRSRPRSRTASSPGSAPTRSVGCRRRHDARPLRPVGPSGRRGAARPVDRRRHRQRHRAELLFLCGIRPDRAAASLTDDEFDELWRRTVELMQGRHTPRAHRDDRTRRDRTVLGAHGRRGPPVRTTGSTADGAADRSRPRRSAGGRSGNRPTCQPATA